MCIIKDIKVSMASWGRLASFKQSELPGLRKFNKIVLKRNYIRLKRNM